MIVAGHEDAMSKVGDMRSNQPCTRLVFREGALLFVNSADAAAFLVIPNRAGGLQQVRLASARRC